ncbi:MAG: molecular chaperone HtpG [Acidobacteriota bacterium]
MAQKTDAPKKATKAKTKDEAAEAKPTAKKTAAKKPAANKTATKPKTASKAKPAKAESFEFQAETRQLLDIVIHSLYSNKEIFLRELISNASDALDRLRFEALTEPKLMEGAEKLEIRLETDPDARTLTVADNGVGMSRDEVISNIGTIAKSGTRELMAKLKEGESAESLENLIGQFGVGFYSGFMVADRVSVVTRRAGEGKATRWESTGDGSYTLADDHRFLRGTSITLHLKPADSDNGIDDYTDFHTLQRIVKKHSDFVTYPVITKHQREESERDEDGKEIEGSSKTVIEEKTLNSMRPIWTRPESEVKEEEYAEFYKHISHDWNEPLSHLSLRAEGRIEYRALLFLPKKAPYDLYFRDQKFGLQLYVKRVLIMDNCEDLLPPYLRFVKGVVDSDDLPINISREMVQQDRLIGQMRKWLTRKVLDHLKTMETADREKYLELWGQVGRVLKEGVGFDFENKDRIIPLLYFQSSADPEKLTSLTDYIERMKDDQEEIYYLTGESRAAVESSPHLEAFKEKSYEVLYLVDPVDEFAIQGITEFQDKPLKSVGKGTVELGSEEEKKQAEEELKEKQETYKDLMELLQTKLDDHIKEVRLSNRLTTSPVCLVSGEHDMTPQMERLLRETEGMNAMGMGGPQKRIMELNPKHDILAKLQSAFAEDQKAPVLDDYADLLLGYAYLAEGSDLPDPGRFNQLVGDLMVKGL